MPNLENARRQFSSRLAPPLARLLSKTGLTPNAVTVTGFIMALGAAALIVTGHNLAAGIVVLAAAIFDMLDGALARLTGKTTRFGAVLDSTLDRLSEAALLLALAYVFAVNGHALWSLISGIAMLGSLMVSYIRARIEGIGIECKEGLFTRPERVIIMALALLLSQINYVLYIAVSLMALLTFYTVIERVAYAYRKLK
jgi:CDP-diacylglycerol---glycerol-3-phosphate 3-phosphatidyltransferase